MRLLVIYGPMNKEKSGLPGVLLQSPAVDFIDNHLQEEDHPLFAHGQAHFDIATQRYVLTEKSSTMPLKWGKGRKKAPAPASTPHNGPKVVVTPAPAPAPPPAPTASPPTGDPAPTAPSKRSKPLTLEIPDSRPEDEVKSITRMTFWDAMFPTAMKSFAQNPEPKKRSRSPYHIRLEQSWIGVYEKLGAARQKYIDTKGIAGKLREVRRTLGDNVQIIGNLLRFVPEIDYVTPVLGIVGIMLDVSPRGSLMAKRADMEVAWCGTKGGQQRCAS